VPQEPEARPGVLARSVADAVSRAWEAHGLPPPRLLLEPGRALVGQAGVTLYRVRSVKRLEGVTWAAVDGGMSDNPRPQLYGARYSALLANRAAALWMIKRLNVDGWTPDRAGEEAAALGLTNPALKTFALDYARTHQK